MIELLFFLRDNYPNAYRTLLQAAGYKVQDNNQVLKGDEVINIEQLSIDKQKDLSGRLLRMRAKGIDILQALNGSAQPIPEEDKEKFIQLFAPIVDIHEEGQRRETERKELERKERQEQARRESEAHLRQSVYREDLGDHAVTRLLTLGLIPTNVKPNNSLSFKNYYKIVSKNKKELSTKDLEYYIKTESAFDLLKNKINQSINIINDLCPQTIEILVSKGVVDFNQAMTYFLNRSNYTWPEIKWLVPSLLQSEHFENLSTILNRTTDRGWSNCLQMDFNTISPFFSYLKGRVNNDEFINHIYWERREEILKWMIENEVDFSRKQAIIEFFFKKVYTVSLDLFMYLFDHDFYFSCILSRFRRDYNDNTFDNSQIQNMINRMTQTRAWQIALEIIQS